MSFIKTSQKLKIRRRLVNLKTMNLLKTIISGTDDLEDNQKQLQKKWRLGPESNRATWICNPVHNRFATQPLGASITLKTNDVPPHLSSISLINRRFLEHIIKKTSALRRGFEFGAGNEARTRDPNLGKVVLYH